MTDPISDMLNRILNAQAVSHETLSLPFSNLKYEVASILQKEGLIKAVEKKGRKEKRTLKIDLKYAESVSNGKVPAISGARRVSKPGQRIYASVKELKPVKGGYGVAIVSTPKGLMTGKEAKKVRLGGEVICEVW